jgi:hypothetical protein
MAQRRPKQIVDASLYFGSSTSFDVTSSRISTKLATKFFPSLPLPGALNGVNTASPGNSPIAAHPAIIVSSLSSPAALASLF